MYKINKLNTLLKANQNLFHTQDLAILWGIRNKNTLYVSIQRFLKKGILYKVIKGLYSTLPLEEIDKFTLGTSLLHKFCYISFETVLEKEGVINQKVFAITYAAGISKKIELNGDLYIYRQVQPQRLFDPNGVEKKHGYFMATRERAISDMKYINPKYYFDNIK